jgi:enoyl-CoA hydratase/carnithine racemase
MIIRIGVERVAAEDPVLVDVGDDAVAVVTLNRPEHRNAWNPVLEKRYFEILEDVDRDSRVRVVIVTGSGTTFCPGVDSGRLDTLAGRAMDLSDRRSPALPWAIRKPIVAAINGACAGMGLMQALLCDVRFAARGARFTTAFARRGLAAGFGISWLLPRLIGAGRASDLLLSGRVFDADEALELGVVNRVVEPADLMSVARAYAADLAANCSPLSLALIRHQLRVDQRCDFGTAIRRAYHVEDYALQEPDFREGMDSYLQKRAPRFHSLNDALDPAEITQASLPEATLIPAHANSP